jgi:iron complex outermembrane receptor protein
VVYSARQDHVDPTLRETPTPPYAVVNLRGGTSVRWVRLTVGIANLLDRTYYEHLSYQRDPFRSGATVYEPGRNVYVNLAMVF